MKCRKVVNNNIVWFGSYGKQAPTFEQNKYYKFENETYTLLISQPIDWLEKYFEYYEYDINENLYYHVVGKALKADNYSEKQEAVRDSLIQRLNVIKSELWYNPSYGLPLFEKIRNKGIFDAIVISIIMSHPDVRAISSYQSEISNHQYSFSFSVVTRFSENEILISSNIIK